MFFNISKYIYKEKIMIEEKTIEELFEMELSSEITELMGNGIPGNGIEIQGNGIPISAKIDFENWLNK